MSNCGNTLKLCYTKPCVERQPVAGVTTKGMVKTSTDVLAMGNPQPTPPAFHFTMTRAKDAVQLLNGNGLSRAKKVPLGVRFNLAHVKACP